MPGQRAGAEQEADPTATATRVAEAKKAAAELTTRYLRRTSRGEHDSATLARLRTLDAALLVPPLSRALASAPAAVPAAALRLARQLRVPQLFRHLERDIGGPLDTLILEYGIAVGAPRALEVAWPRWLGPNGQRWQVVHNAFLDFGLPPAWFERADAALQNAAPERRELVLDVLRRSTHRPDLTPERFHAAWPELQAECENERRSFARRGIDLLATRDRRSAHDAARIGRNLRLGPGGDAKIEATAAWYDSRGIALWVRPRAGARAVVDLRSTDGSWAVVFEGGEWSVETGDGERYAVPGTSDAWTRVTFDFESERPVDGTPTRVCRIRIGSRRLLDRGELSPGMTELLCLTRQAACTLAGVELLK